MHLALLTVKFHLPGCSSLKEKRHRLLGLKDKFGKSSNIAVTESAYHDNHQSSEWTFVIISVDKTIVEQQLSQIERHISTEVDALVENIQREWL